ncbi:MAG: hypothetical protein SOZ87_00840 [Candidatus Cryptobacteroides sp.]|nr:hypothetical protein [Candidatus Cryptobacteroides sp.]
MMHGTKDDIVPYEVTSYGGYSFRGSSALAKALSDNGYDYRIYRYLGNNHTVAGFMHFTLDIERDFLERNVMQAVRLNVDAQIEDPSLPYYPSGDSNLYDIKTD